MARRKRRTSRRKRFIDPRANVSRRRTMIARIPALLLWLGSAVVVAAQQVPARDAPARPSVGTASISGMVVSDDPSGRPVRRVVLTLTPAGSGMTVSRSTTTDDEGHFAF